MSNNLVALLYLAAGVLFVLDDLAEDLFQALDNGAFRFTKSHLVGHLKDIPQGFGSFSVEAAHSQAELV